MLLEEVKVNYKTSKEHTYFEELNDQNIIGTGTKNDIIQVQNTNTTLSNNNVRSTFSKIPGMLVREIDASGTKISFGIRGLNSSYGQDTSIRQNGVLLAQDPVLYPEAYYAPILESVEKVEFIKGGASLQYGSMFGGVMNYVYKNPSKFKKFEFNTVNTFSDYNYINSFNSIEGSLGKFSYYAFVNRKSGDSWRENNEFEASSAFVKLYYDFSNSFKTSVEYSYSNVINQVPGGLLDSQLYENPKQSFRSRNWFEVPLHLIALNTEYNLSEKTKITTQFHTKWVERNAIGNFNNISVADNLTSARDLFRDASFSYGADVRISHKYNALGSKNILAVGISYLNVDNQKQNGAKGTANSNADYTQTTAYTTDVSLKTKNTAFYIQHLFNFNDKWKFTPGFRYEFIDNTADGILSNYQNSNQKSNRSFPLFGIGLEYILNNETSIYGNISQAYKAATFSNISLSGPNDIVDENLQDSKGYSADLGIKGTLLKYITYDIGAYFISYQNRIGTNIIDGKNFKTNIGDSEHKGIEILVEADFLALIGSSSNGKLSPFVSMAFNNSEYKNYIFISQSGTQDYSGNKVEYSPTYVHRFGLKYALKNFSISYQFSTTSEVYSDALNTEAVSSNSQIGKIPSYTVSDLGLSYHFYNKYTLKANINNLYNQTYFTNRSAGYSGQGALPADKRTLFLSIGARF